MKTIVAISTPIGNGGISIVRLSGPNSFSIAKKMVSKIKDNSLNFEDRKMYLCKINAETFSDIGLVVFFKNPNSFTGEDIVEFQVHGGAYLSQGIVKKCLSLGAVMAEPGEFSKRAFLNGKTSLDALEGVIDLINSESDAQIKAAFDLASGKFFELVKSLQNELTNILAEINVSLDYPDEQQEDGTLNIIVPKLKNIDLKIDELIKTFDKGKLIKSGINCAIVGLPNAGKSSLLNSLLNESRAIVSSIAGTTRDVIKESFLINGMKVNLIDTAGINDADNEIEKIGVDKAYIEADKADVILYLIDASKKISEQDVALINKFKNKNLILILNKSDISIKENNELFKKYDTLEISALNNFNIDLLKEKIYSFFSKINVQNDFVIITNERHFNALKNASVEINNCLNIKNVSIEVVASFVQNAYNNLGEITGETGSDKVIDEIFSKFCLGK